MLKFSLSASLASALAVGLAACGGSSSSASSSASSAPPSSTSTATSTTPASTGSTGGGLSLAADPSGQLKFDQTSLSANAGTVTIKFTNGSMLGHNLTIETSTSGPVIGASPTFQGGSKVLTLHLKPGTYTFFCSVDGHRAAGMQGTLTVS